MDVTRRDHIKNVDITANLDITEDIRKNPGKKTMIFRSCGQNGPTPFAKHCVIWQSGREESQRKTQEALAG